MVAMVVTPEYISDIITVVINAIIGEGGRARATNYLHYSYEADINLGTPDGLKLYLKAAGASTKDEDRI